MRRTSLPVSALALLLCTAFAVVAGLLILHGSDDQHNHVTVLGKRIELTANEARGHTVFAVHCAACHELAASRSVGVSGPNLDSVQLTAAQVQTIVENGKVGTYGVMPAGLATGPDLYAVAQYVAHVSNRKAYKP